MNGAKRDIDQYNEMIKSKRALSTQNGASSGDDVIDAEEFSFFKSLKESKQRCRDSVAELRGQKDRLGEILEVLAGKRAEMLAGFDVWYETEGNSGLGAAIDDDELDAAEQFEKLELDRVMATDPEALAFYAAKKTNRRRAKGLRVQDMRREKAALMTAR